MIQSKIYGGEEVYSVDEISHAVHFGIAFMVSNIGVILAGATVSMLGRTGSKEVHLDGFDIAGSDGNMSVNMYEAPTISADGIPVDIIARNRAKSEAPTHTVFANPTITGVGLLLEHSEVFSTGSQGSHLTGSSGNISEDWILKPNTEYLIQITNNSTGDISYVSKFVWSEV